MTKIQFLSELRERLSGLPQEDMDERLSFYSEMIDDRMEEGLTEDEAVAEAGTVDDVVAQILSEYPFAKIFKEKVKTKRQLKAWEIVLLILGFPVWFPLLVAAFAVVFSLFIALWAAVVALWAASVAVAASSLCAVIAGIVFSVTWNFQLGMAAFGAGLFGLGLAILMFFGCIAASKGSAILMKKTFIGIKTLFIGKERIK